MADRDGSESGHRWGLVGLLLVAATALACAGGPSGETPDEPSPARSAPSGSVDDDGTMSPEEFERDIRTAVKLAEEYWTGQFRAAGERFRPIQQVGTYRRDGEISCAGQPVPRNNAVYCPAGDFIAYDVDWAVAAFQRIGDAFLYYLLGHEYAHGVQVRLGISYQYTIEQELQADCMAGAYLGDLVRANRLALDEGDLDEFRAGLFAVGDDPGQPWFAEGAHGTAEQRTDAFANGYKRSLDACGLRG